ncbi:MAG: transglycosylase domain-containing protein [Oscillospiraceae bacterium]|nr:transglycosylase domain-containing protein [Oscillospiraceae bacterium]
MNDNGVSKTKKKKPSKAVKAVKTIFFVNFKIFSYIINIVLTILLIVIITGGIVAGTFFFYIVNYIDPTMPDLVTMSSESKLTTFIYYYKYDDRFEKTNPQLVEMDQLHGSENRTWVKYSEITKNNTYLVDAFVALEDRRFWEHKGVDWFRTAAAASNFFMPSDGATYGGSTISQQLVKLMTDDDDQTIQRKIQEIRRAMYIESRTSKEEILENYLNTVLLSNGCYGVQSAANTLFNKNACDLNLIEAAAIASIVQSPTKMNPITRPERNKDRRDECLKNMLSYGLITKEEFDGAYDKELAINRPEKSYVETVKSYYVDQIIEDVMAALMEKYGYTRQQASNKLYSGGLKIYSCMDPDIQGVMEWVYSHDEYFPAQPEGALKYQSAMVVIDPYTGYLLGIMGGRDEKVQRGLNRASGSVRQAGSSIKPVSVYAPAIDQNIINWGTPMNDSPPMTLNNRPWPPNYPAGNEGMISLSRAIAVSKNTTAVWTLMQLTPEVSFRFMYDQLNIRSLVEEMTLPSGRVMSDVDYAPLALGAMTNGVSVYDLTAAYAMFANEGIYTKPRSFTLVTDQDGNVILDNAPERKMVIEEETAWIMTKLLRGVVEDGTAKGLKMKNKIEVAGKTGTTNEEYDRWFIGFTPYYLCGCWFGYDLPKYMNVPAGDGNPPMLLFNYVMDTIHEPIYGDPKKFPELPTIVEAKYCKRSGLAPGPNCGSTDTGYYSKSSEPKEICKMCYAAPPKETETEEIEETSEDTRETDENSKYATETWSDLIAPPYTNIMPPYTEPESQYIEPTLTVAETTAETFTEPETIAAEEITEPPTEEPTLGGYDNQPNWEDFVQ